MNTVIDLNIKHTTRSQRCDSVGPRSAKSVVLVTLVITEWGLSLAGDLPSPHD